MKTFRFIFILGLFAFLATNFPLGRVGVFARFPIILLMLAACVIMISRIRTAGISPVLLTLYLFLTYSFITTFWTENVLLSLAKWLLYVLVTLVFLVAGATVGQNTKPGQNPFESLKWPFLTMVVSCVISLIAGSGWVEGNFRGMSGNSNALGASLMLTTPWLIYELKRTWLNRRVRRVLIALSFLTAGIMLATHSRAALCGFVMLPLFAGQQLKVGRKVTVAYTLVMMLIITFALRPGTFDSLYHSYVVKRADSITSSRGTQMEESWDAAKQGGVLGEGFGVSVGLSRYWDYSTFSRLSREKGNSFLAIVEETGVIGLALYVAVLGALFGTIRRFSKKADPDRKFICNIAMGFFVAALIHGQFEAWFLSFGPDVSVYWGILGLALGAITRRTEDDRKTRVETASRARVFAPAPVAGSR